MNTNTQNLDNDPRVIVRYHPRKGKVYFSLDTNDFICDETGQPIPAGTKTTRCPHCGAVKKVKP
jgi:hypothetical protein